MLMARMDTHPEEFTAEVNYGASRWSDLVQQWKHCLPKEDMEAFETKLKEVHAQHFTELVLEELVDPKKSGKSNWETVNDTLSGGQTQQHMAIHQAWLAQQAKQAQAQLAQNQAQNQAAQAQVIQDAYRSGLYGAGQGLLGSLFGGRK